MLSSNKQVLEICLHVSKKKNLKAVHKKTFKFAAITVVGVLLGGLVGGPRGVAIGATAAAVCATMLSSGGGKALDEVIRVDLNDKERNQLVNVVWEVMNGEDVGMGVNCEEIEDRVVEEMRKFFDNNLDLKVVCA